MRYQTQQEFYKSKEWESFRKIIINERTQDDGFIYCDICHKPILKKYDLILHHKQELDGINVNDVNVSLNPANIETVHFKCHNQIHERFGYSTTNHHPKKNVYIVYGSPCAGKTTWVHDVATEKDLIVDLDSIWQMVSINDKYTKPDALRSVVFEIRDKMYEIIKYRNGNWHNAYIITGAPLKGDRDRLKTRISADEMIFIDTPMQECLNRVSTKGLPKAEEVEWIKYIQDWFSKYQAD